MGEELTLLAAAAAHAAIWSYHRFHRTYRVVQADTFAFQQNVLQAEMRDGRLDASSPAWSSST